jgi:hypothetical protein
VRVDDMLGEDAAPAPGRVELRMSQDGGAPVSFYPPAGQDYEMVLRIGHAGQNVYEMEVPPIEGEMSLANNRLAIVVNGVRDRLRVLLVSGEPHPGERTWRNLLKSDPSIDLVHFTILRPPDKQDMTPINELSLIAFPVNELFEAQLHDFDLMIFDRYRMRGVLPTFYLQNIADYVRGGGAFLEAGGPDFTTPLSLFQTPIGEILPGAPGPEGVISEPFRPQLTDLGLRHPVTAALADPQPGLPPPDHWGRWFRQVDLSLRSGQVLMSGIAGKPLVVLDRVGEGRVAQIASDQAWLWQRGFEGGGPQSELLRRTAHWLMKEPELEENSLVARVSGNQVTVERRKLDGQPNAVTLRTPSAVEGEDTVLEMKEAGPGLWRAVFTAEETGIYRVSDGELVAVAAVGRVNPPELADLRTTSAPLDALVAASGGGVEWLVDGMPGLRRVRPGHNSAGSGWVGLRANGQYTVDRVADMPILPAGLALLLALGGLVWAWRREGR